MKAFYMKYFGCTSNELYHNPKKEYKSYFLSFAEGGARIELMTRTDITEEPSHRGFLKGIAHLDIIAGSETDVNNLHDRLKEDGYTIASELRHTGDGYYEFAVLDPEGNYVEISAES
jgi:lactoylglutathione lyase